MSGVFLVRSSPIAYLITFRTYATWLHGDERGSVDHDHNTPGTPLLGLDAPRHLRETRRLKHAPITFERPHRVIVHRTILEVAAYRGWTIHTLHVPTNHVHVVIAEPQPPEHVMTSLKSWSTRRLVDAGLLRRGSKVWSQHGSTCYLWKPEELAAACRYVCLSQGAELDGPRSMSVPDSAQAPAQRADRATLPNPERKQRADAPRHPSEPGA